VRVSVRQQGGAFGVDKTVEVVDDKVRVTDSGQVQREASIDQGHAKEVPDLASAVMSSTVSPGVGAVYDAMTTALEIDDGVSKSKLLVRSGDDASPEVWRLVNMVNAAPDRSVKE
jgi:hypothetical protein